MFIYAYIYSWSLISSYLITEENDQVSIVNWFLVGIIIRFVVLASTDYFPPSGPVTQNTPPILSLPEGGEWMVHHTTPVEERVATVPAFDVSGDEGFTFSIHDRKGLLGIDRLSGDVVVKKPLLREVR